MSPPVLSGSVAVASIPDGWDSVTIGDIATKVGSGITPTGGSQVYGYAGRPFIRSQNVGWGTLLLDDVAHISDTIHATFVDTELRLHDVLLNITGASIGRSAVAESSIVGGNVNQHVCIIRAQPSSADPLFINSVLLSPSGQRQIAAFQAGGNRQGLNFEQVRSIRIPLPPLPEQRAIAAALSDVDDLVAGLDRLIAKKRAIKQGVMHDLLTGRKRLPGFSGEWQVRRLGDLGFVYGGLTAKTKADFGTGDARYVPFLNVLSNVSIDLAALERVRLRDGERQNLVVKDDLLFNGSSETPEEVALCAHVPDSVANTYLNSFCFGFRPYPSAPIHPPFLAYYFRSGTGRALIKSLAQGSTRYNISKIALLSTPLPLPPLPEQRAIAAALTDLDDEIDALQARRDKTSAIKQAMMAELLTGRTRLV